MRYPLTITLEDDGYVITLNHPGGRFQGATFAEDQDSIFPAAVAMVCAMLESALREGDPIPAPEECEPGTAELLIPPILAVKVQLLQEMQRQGLRKADIARAMVVNPRQVDRIFDPNHRPTLPQLEKAAAALGTHIEVSVVKNDPPPRIMRKMPRRAANTAAARKTARAAHN